MGGNAASRHRLTRPIDRSRARAQTIRRRPWQCGGCHGGTAAIPGWTVVVGRAEHREEAGRVGDVVETQLVRTARRRLAPTMAFSGRRWCAQAVGVRAVARRSAGPLHAKHVAAARIGALAEAFATRRQLVGNTPEVRAVEPAAVLALLAVRVTTAGLQACEAATDAGPTVRVAFARVAFHPDSAFDAHRREVAAVGPITHEVARQAVVRGRAMRVVETWNNGAGVRPGSVRGSSIAHRARVVRPFEHRVDDAGDDDRRGYNHQRAPPAKPDIGAYLHRDPPQSYYGIVRTRA